MRHRLLVTCFGLAAALPLCAQPRLSVNKEAHHFGKIGWKIPATVEYIITNTGNKPLVLTEITTSCACAATEWTQRPIPPGGSGIVRAVFDAKALGKFRKTVSIYSNASPHLRHLTFDGEVLEKVETIYEEISLPYRFGKIETDKNALVFPDSRRGEQPVVKLTVCNQSNKIYTPVLMHLPSYIKAETDKPSLDVGERTTIKLTLDTRKLLDVGLTQATVHLSRHTGDKVNENNAIPLSIILLPAAEQIGGNPDEAPCLRLSESEIDLSGSPTRKPQKTSEVILTNTGKEPLKILKLQVFDQGVNVKLQKKLILPGESTQLRINLLRNRLLSKHKADLRVLIITNDPKQPKAEINIKP